MNARSTPARIGEAHLPDEIANFGTEGWATLATPTLPTPIKPETLAVPGDDGFGLEDEQCRPPIIPQAGEPDPEDSIRTAETKLVATARTLQDQKLMAESKNLSLQNEARSKSCLQCKRQCG